MTLQVSKQIWLRKWTRVWYRYQLWMLRPQMWNLGKTTLTFKNRFRIKDVFGQSFRKVNTPLRLLSSGDETQPLHSPYRFGAVKSTPTQMEIKQHVKPPLQIVNFPPDSDEKAHPVIRGGIRCCAPPSPPTVSGLGIRKVPGYGNNIFPVAASKPVVTHQSLIDPVWATPQVDPTPQPKVINMSEELGQIKFSKHSQTKLKAKPSPQHNKLGIDRKSV